MNFFPPKLPPERDRVKHFANDGPQWKLSALFIERLPAILVAMGWVVAASVAAAFWFSR